MVFKINDKVWIINKNAKEYLEVGIIIDNIGYMSKPYVVEFVDYIETFKEYELTLYIPISKPEYLN